MTIYALGERRPQLPSDGNFWIAPDANVIGDVQIGSGCSVWFCATLRGDSEPIILGAGTNIQENCVLHTDPEFPLTLGENCSVGHKAMLHGCTISDGTLVGMGASVLNGAKIGRGCLIGAGALIPEGKEIPDGSLVMGMPGRVIRKLDEKHIKMNRAAAEHYQSRQKEYREGFRAISDTAS